MGASNCTGAEKQMAPQHFKYVVLGGGQAAGYAAREFVAQGVKAGELAIIGDEKNVAYERPALSKAYLAAEKPARLPGFHTCVGGGGDRQDPAWYTDKGIAYQTGASVSKASLAEKKLTLADGAMITYETLIIATGAKPLSLAGKTPGAELGGIHYLRNIEDADGLIAAMAATKAKGGKVVLLGGGYIGMEVAAQVVGNGLAATLVTPDTRLMGRLFTPELSAFYEKAYGDKGVTIVKGARATGFKGVDGKVTHVVLDSGGQPSELEADLVVVGIGARPSSELFEGQLAMDKGGIKVNGSLLTSVAGVYAVGDVALFPLKMHGGGLVRQEHVINARQTAAHAVKAIYGSAEVYDYLPSFYSRVFALSWVFYGKNEGRPVHFGDQAAGKFGAYWVLDGKVVGAFLEGGSPEEATYVKQLATTMPPAPDSDAELADMGILFGVNDPGNSLRSV